MNEKTEKTKPNLSDAFPWDIPSVRPDRPLSMAFERLYQRYLTPRPEDNPLFTSFKYTRLEGFEYRNGDGTLTRRDPSKIVFEEGRYYVWYTKRDTACPPRGAAQCTELIPSTDWDLAEIWYATSDDGFVWKEQGVAIQRPSKPTVGWRSVATPDILKWKGRFYLYYQAFQEASGIKGDHCPVAVSYSDSPDGPWVAVEGISIENGEAGSWDQFSIHGPSPIVFRGKIYLYYKTAFGDRPDYLVGLGLATADHPLGPFEKHPLNPVMNSGHETTFFPFRSGVAAFSIRNGNEANTIQYSEDGVNFEIAAVSTLFPTAAKAYDPDAFTDSGNGRGIEWGLCHFTNGGLPGHKYGLLARFDCMLRSDKRDPSMENTHVNISPDVYFQQRLSEEQRKSRASDAVMVDKTH